MEELHPRRRNNIMTELPPDITFFHILPRLPAKSLLRFMCVCKQWHLFLTTPTFAKMHLRHVANDDHQNHHKHILLSTRSPWKFQTIDCEAPEDGLSAHRSLPFEASTAEKMWIIASLNGLVCIGIKKCKYDLKYSDLILWNPFIGDYKILSKPNSHEECYETTGRAFGLYYTSSEDDYRLVRVTHYRNVYLYSLKSDSWRKVDSRQDFKLIPFCISERWSANALLNEKLYFLKEFRKGSLSPQSYSIIRFELNTEKFKEIPTPPFRNILSTACLSFTVVRGCIHFWVTNQMRKTKSIEWYRTIELWRMDGDEDWMKVVSYHRNLCGPWCQQPLHMMRNGNLLNFKANGRIYKVDLEKNTKDGMCSYDANSMDIPLEGKYIESLVSPNQYIDK